MKKKMGRPNTTGRPPFKPKYGGMTKKEIGALIKGIDVVQLDYFTGEYIGEYPSILEAEEDNDLPITSLNVAFNRHECCMVYNHKRELLFMKKEDYLKMIGSAPHERERNASNL